MYFFSGTEATEQFRQSTMLIFVLTCRNQKDSGCKLVQLTYTQAGFKISFKQPLFSESNSNSAL